MPKSGAFPQRVVRFFGNVAFALETIGTRQITMVHASLVNDPFDPYLFLETDFNADYQALLDYIHDRHPNDFGWFIREFPIEAWPHSVAAVQRFFDDLKKRTFIFSTSAVVPNDHPKDNLYMWGHYGNGHRGVAIEFNTLEIGGPIIEEYNKNYQGDLIAESAWTQIGYEKNLPVVTRSMFYDFLKSEHFNEARLTKLHQYYNIISSTKSVNWRSENEWRLLWQRDDTRSKIIRQSISERAIERIYLGLQLSGNAQDDIIFEAKQQYPAAEVFKAEKRHGAFALDFKRVS